MIGAVFGEYVGARFAFNRTLHYKPGHSQALFQQGLIEESRGNMESAVEMFAKAIQINHQLLDPKTNPRVLDSKLIHLALLRAYPNEHTRESVMFQATPPNSPTGSAMASGSSNSISGSQTGMKAFPTFWLRCRVHGSLFR